MSRKAMWVVVLGWTLLTLLGPIVTFWLTLLQLAVITFSVIAALAPTDTPSKAAAAPWVPATPLAAPVVSPAPPAPPAPPPAPLIHQPAVPQLVYGKPLPVKKKLKLRWVALAILVVAASIRYLPSDDSAQAPTARPQPSLPRAVALPKAALPVVAAPLPALPVADVTASTRRARLPIKATDFRHCLALASDAAMAKCAEKAR